MKNSNSWKNIFNNSDVFLEGCLWYLFVFFGFGASFSPCLYRFGYHHLHRQHLRPATTATSSRTGIRQIPCFFPFSTASVGGVWELRRLKMGKNKVRNRWYLSNPGSITDTLNSRLRIRIFVLKLSYAFNNFLKLEYHSSD